MRFSAIATAAAAFASSAQGLNILITNDDGFGTAYIREMYKAVKALGHNAYIVASATEQSGKGGTLSLATSPKLTADTQFGIVKAGAPSVGTDPNDSHIWYYNGTPAAQIMVALDYILPTFGDFDVPDLVMSGPNYGQNLGPAVYPISGTVGATYTAVERGIPAIAFSGAGSVSVPYYYTNSSTPAGLQDPATVLGRLCASLAQAFIDKADGDRILPLGYGVNVNLPFITSYTNTSCVNPPFVLSRLTGSAYALTASYNAATGLFGMSYTFPDAVNTCINGDCSLPGETEVYGKTCMSSVSVFTIDYDAPEPSTHKKLKSPRDIVPSLVQDIKSRKLVGGLGKHASVKASKKCKSTKGCK